MPRLNSTRSYFVAALQRDRVVLPVTLLLLAIYVTPRADQGWIMWDEGLIGQTAELVMNGALPHRDYDEPYTGGLAMLNSLAFRLWGVNLLGPRRILLGFTMVFALAIYLIARRVTAPWLAASITILCISWSVPNAFGSFPSWYNLFFAVFGCLALFRFVETDRRRYLFLAGLAGGVSLLFKIAGLYYIAAGLLFLVYREQNEAEADESTLLLPSSWFTRAGLLLFGWVVISVIARRPLLMDLIAFALPGVAIAGALLLNDIRLARLGYGVSIRRLLVNVGSFVAGASIPVAIFMLPYLASGATRQLFEGVFLQPLSRFEHGSRALPHPLSLTGAIPLMILLALPLVSRRRIDGPLVVLAAALMSLLVVWKGHTQLAYILVWWSVRYVVPLVSIVVASMMLTRGFRSQTAAKRETIFIVAALSAIFTLVQFPWSVPFYFYYTAPLAILSVLFVSSAQSLAPNRLLFTGVVFYTVFAALWCHTGNILTVGGGYVRDQSDTVPALDRVRLRVPLHDARILTELVATIQQHSSEGSFIYAAPDSPEAYFYAARKNSTGGFYDFMDDDYGDPEARKKRILDALEERNVDLVVFKRASEFSAPVEPSLSEELIVRYPHSKVVGGQYVVRWRDPGASSLP